MNCALRFRRSVAIGLLLAAAGFPAGAFAQTPPKMNLAMGTRGPGEEDFAFMAIQVSDIKKAVAFYKDILGFVEWYSDTTTTQIRVGVDFPSYTKGPRIMLLQNKDQQGIPEKGKLFNRYCFWVKDINAIVEKLKAANLPARGPNDLKAVGTKVVFSQDDDGNTREFMEKY